jgi:hypothetical protein
MLIEARNHTTDKIGRYEGAGGVMDENMGEVMLCQRFKAEATGFLARGTASDGRFDRKSCGGTFEQGLLACANDWLNV